MAIRRNPVAAEDSQGMRVQPVVSPRGLSWLPISHGQAQHGLAA